MIDLTKETPIPLSDARSHRLLRTRGRSLDKSTLHKYATSGVRGIRLGTVDLPSGRHTTEEAIFRFIEALTNLDRPETPRGSSQAQQTPPREQEPPPTEGAR